MLSVSPLPLLFGTIAIFGLAEALAGALLLRRFCRRSPPTPSSPPPLTVLKPLAGAEPVLEEALASLYAQDYPEFQIVFGAADAADPALAVAGRLAHRFPARETALVADPTQHGTNRKVSNLINMFPAARHDVLVIADADVHAPPGYLSALAAGLEAPGTGLVSTLYTGRPGVPGLPARLGASRIAHDFLPGVLIGEALGRQDTLGATMALSREVLARSGGFAALANELADDAVLGLRVKALGLAVRLAGTIPATTIAESRFEQLFRHELRWARTVRSLVPVGHAASALGYPLVWALAAVAASAAAPWSVALLIVVWAGRAAAARAVERALGVPPVLTYWLLPLREVFSLVVLLVSYAGNRVEWRGAVLHAGRPGGGDTSCASKKGLAGQ